MTRDDVEALRKRTLQDAALDVIGVAVKRDVDQGRARVPADADAVMLSPAALDVPVPDDDVEPVDAFEELTGREQEVLALLADGRGNRDIAARLHVSEHTVKFHLASIFGKLGASTRTEAVRKGLQLGLIDI